MHRRFDRHEIDAASRPASDRLGRRTLARRVRAAAEVALLGAAALLVLGRVAPVGIGVLRPAAAAASSLAVIALVRRRYEARALGAALVVAHAAALLAGTRAPAPAAAAVTWLLLGATAAFPWGTATQAAVAAGVTLVAGVVAHPGAAGTEFWGTLAVGGTLSVVGAAAIARGRGAACAARQRRRALAARQRARASLAREEAARASALHAEFVTTLSHAVRTPLDVIVGAHEMLRDGLPPDCQTARALDAVRRASLDLLDLVDATFDLGPLAAGRARTREEPVPVAELFDDLARDYSAVPRASSVALLWDAGVGPVLWTDRRRLKTILAQLVDNALQFTPAGSVRVVCRLGAERCTLHVIDTGVGMRSEDRAALLASFTGSRRADRGPVGLGLHVVHRLARLLDADLQLDSTPGVGTVVTVALPARLAHDRRSAA
jgi:signal transduction histidine kinase